MLYLAYQSQSDLLDPVRTVARSMLTSMGPWMGTAAPGSVRSMAAAYELIARAGLTHTRPSYGIDEVPVGNEMVAVEEKARFVAPFGTLLHFKKDVAVAQPRVLVVAPLSGHFATLLRNTIKTLLSDHDVYVTDWHNARDVPLSAGAFGFEVASSLTLVGLIRVSIGPALSVIDRGCAGLSSSAMIAAAASTCTQG